MQMACKYQHPHAYGVIDVSNLAMGLFKSKLLKTVVLSRMRDKFLIQNVSALNDENLQTHSFAIVFLFFFF